MSDKPVALTTTVDIDTDTVNPDSLKASFVVAIDALVSRAEGHRVGLNWNSLECALYHRGSDTTLAVRAGVLQ